MGGKRNLNEVKGFTIAELLIVMALTSLAITLSYGTLTYIQKLFSEYKKQNKFLNEFTDLKKRLDYESLKSDMVTEESENTFIMTRDSFPAKLQIKEHVVLLEKKERCDTFHIQAKNITKTYEYMKNPVWINKLVATLQFEVEYTNQKFVINFTKQHAAAVKLKLDQEN